MGKKIVIVGCGQLGSRHLQAVIKLKYPLKIQIVEPDEKNQEIAMDRAKEIISAGQDIQLEWYKSINNIDHNPDLTIVATPSIGRSAILMQLLDMGHQRFLIEKMICQSDEEYEDILKSLTAKKARGWVDCTRPYFPFYRKLIDIMEKEQQIFFKVSGGNHGLGSNIIHFLELFGRIRGSLEDITLFGDHLYPSLLPNKRGEHLVEFAGTIIASTPERCLASIAFHPLNNAPIIVDVMSEHYRALVNENSTKALFAAEENGWQWEESNFEVMFSSSLTTEIAHEIMENDACRLTTLEDIYPVHKNLVNLFNDHICKISGKRPLLCPIT